MCYERHKKYIVEALRPIIELKKYKMSDSAAVREFNFMLRAAIKGVRTEGHLKLLINEQTNPQHHGKDAAHGLEAVGNEPALLNKNKY